ncbi:MAG: ABC transporter ATP-binding protein [Rhizomicrobium sp.]
MTGGVVSISAQELGKAYFLYPQGGDWLSQFCRGKRRSSFQEFWALKNVTLELRRGEALGVIGENGAGKSTLLRLLCGTVRPTTGHVQVSGRLAALLELGAGFNPRFTGRENVWLNAAVLGLSKAEIAARFDAIADFAGIGEFIDLPVKLYSSGMRARLAFAVSAHVDADILIVDEVLSVGDAAFAQKCALYMEAFRARGTLLFVSHNSGLVAKLCDRALWLEHGEPRELGAAPEVCANYITSLAERTEAQDRRERAPPARAWEAVPSPPLVRDKRTFTTNRIEVSALNPDAPWHGHGGARIVDAYLRDARGARLSQIEGGNEVDLRVVCVADRELARPIVGFILRDRLGQNVFGDSTYLACRGRSPVFRENETFVAGFRFQLPFLARGEYTLTLAITDGTQDSHVHIHWVEDAVALTARQGPVRRGIIGVPASDVHIETAASA